MIFYTASPEWIIPKDNPKEFIKLQDRKTEEQYDLKDGLVITEKLAKLLEIEENDILKLSGTDTYKEKIAHITENYLFHIKKTNIILY